MFKTLDDYKSKEEKADNKNTSSYVGGASSGLNVENADDISGIVQKAQEGSERRREMGDEKGSEPDTDVKITLYANGYVVDGGELQQYDTEEGKEFMSELNKGYIPEPLRKKYPGKKLGVALEDKR